MVEYPKESRQTDINAASRMIIGWKMASGEDLEHGPRLRGNLLHADDRKCATGIRSCLDFLANASTVFIIENREHIEKTLGIKLSISEDGQ